MARRRDRDWEPDQDDVSVYREAPAPAVPPKMRAYAGLNEAAVERVKRLIPISLATIEKVLNVDCEYIVVDDTVFCREHGSECPTWTVRVKAAFGLLDRAGMGPHSVVHTDDNGPGLRDMPYGEIAAQLEGMAAKARELSAPRVEDIVVEAVAVEPERGADETVLVPSGEAER